MYAAYLKRPLDILLSLLAIVFLAPVLLVLTIAGAVIMRGNPFFVQSRPGKKDKNGKFPLGTINYLAYEKLKKFSMSGSNQK